MIITQYISEPYYTLLKYKLIPVKIIKSSYDDIKKDDIIIFINNLFIASRSITFRVDEVSYYNKKRKQKCDKCTNLLTYFKRLYTSLFTKDYDVDDTYYNNIKVKLVQI